MTQQSEQNLLKHQSPTHAYTFSHTEYIVVEGPDSAKFMQGQFTCDINQVDQTHYARGACCNPKGRMVASFDIGLIGEDKYLLTLSEGLAQPLLDHLKKYAAFFKTELSIARYQSWGVVGADAQDVVDALTQHTPQEAFEQVLENNLCLRKLPYNAGFEVTNLASNELPTPLQDYFHSNDNGWHLNLIQNGLSRITLATHLELIPQTINLDKTHGVSFKKGCYTGQEIVARMQYLGKLKRHCYRIGFTHSAPSGSDILAGDKKVGTLVNFAPTEAGFEGLAVIEDKHLNAPLTLASADNSIELLCLPYEPQTMPE